MSYDSFIDVDGLTSISSASSDSSMSFEKHSCETLWSITDFSSTISANAQDYFSPSFAPQDKSSYRWFVGLRLVDRGGEQSIEVFVKPDFLRSTPEKCRCYFSYKLIMETSDLRELDDWNVQSSISSEEELILHCAKRSDIMDKLVNDKFLLRAEISFQLMPDGEITGTFNRCTAIAASRLLNDISSMLESDKFSDVSILVDDGVTQHTIPAHRLLLAARSPFLRAKLTEDTPESKDRSIRMTNIGLKTVHNMLAYIYTGKFDSSLSTEHIIQLLKCSEKYSISGLKEVCEHHLMLRVNDDNVLDCLAAAGLHKARELKAKALETICRNKKSIIRLKDALAYVEMTQEQRLSLLTEIVIEISSRTHPN